MSITKLPSGTVVFLFTDVEGSTRMWEAHADDMAPALRKHDEILRQVFLLHGGHVFKTVGDAFCVAFGTGHEALAAAMEVQRQLSQQQWPATCPIRVRMAIHAGTAEARDDDYFGPPLNRVARLVGVGHGGQILLSQTVFELVRDQLPSDARTVPLGEHRLKDLTRPEPIYQVAAPGLPDNFPPIRSLSSQPNNLPLQQTSFIGRERELNEVQQLLRQHHLLTMIGSGGTGKTRLSLQVAAETMGQFPDGVWFVELAALREASQVSSALAEVLSVTDGTGPDLIKRAAESIGGKDVLLVFDNCEHVIDSVAMMCEQLLRSCPRLKIIASSREPLRIGGEQTFRVPALSLPSPDKPVNAQTLTQYESVRLFIDRALLQNPSFQVTNENAPDVAMLCAQLDGIPLALELAAARIRSLSVGEIAKRLDQRFQILTSGLRTALPRQQTLRALVDWSYELLNPTEKIFFVRMAVFSGSFDAPRAERVGSGHGVEDWECFDLLSSLVDKSLIVLDESDGEPRYRLLETIRQYADQRLKEAGDERACRANHAAAFADYAREVKPHLHSAEQALWIRRIILDTENFRSAIRWSFSPEGTKVDGVTIVSCLSRYWYIRGAFSEGDILCREALAFIDDSTPHEELSVLHNSLGTYATHRREMETAREHFLISRDHAEACGATADMARLHINLSNVEYMRGNFETACEECHKALAAYRELSNDAGIGIASNNIACSLIRLGKLDEAAHMAKQGLEYRQKVGDPWNIAYSLMCLCDICELGEDWQGAKDYAQQAWTLRVEIGDQAGMSESAMAIARFARAQGDRDEIRNQLVLAREALKNVGDARIDWMWTIAASDFLLETKPELSAKIVGAFQSFSSALGRGIDTTEEEWVPDILERLSAIVTDQAELSKLLQEGGSTDISALRDDVAAEIS